jgi:hypothetical protein
MLGANKIRSVSKVVFKVKYFIWTI